MRGKSDNQKNRIKQTEQINSSSTKRKRRSKRLMEKEEKAGNIAPENDSEGIMEEDGSRHTAEGSRQAEEGSMQAEEEISKLGKPGSNSITYPLNIPATSMGNELPATSEIFVSGSLTSQEASNATASDLGIKNKSKSVKAVKAGLSGLSKHRHDINDSNSKNSSASLVAELGNLVDQSNNEDEEDSDGEDDDEEEEEEDNDDDDEEEEDEDNDEDGKNLHPTASSSENSVLMNSLQSANIHIRLVALQELSELLIVATGIFLFQNFQILTGSIRGRLYAVIKSLKCFIYCESSCWDTF